MSIEKPSHSENYTFQEDWEALNMIGEITILPVEILGDLVGEAFEGFE